MLTPDPQEASKLAIVASVFLAAVVALGWLARALEGPWWFAVIFVQALILLGALAWILRRYPPPLALDSGAVEASAERGTKDSG